MRMSQGLALLVALLMGCSGGKAKHPQRMNDTIRYRLPLRDNPVSSREASRCFAECQPAPTPKQYIECLELCPGFEKTPGEVPIKNEPPPGLVVLAVVGQVALVVGAVSLCNVSSTHCRIQNFPPPK
jgi:hypothetical protein